MLSGPEAVSMLRSKVATFKWSDVDSDELLVSLDFLPLAITQAAAFVKENCITIADYPELLRTIDSSMKNS